MKGKRVYVNQQRAQHVSENEDVDLEWNVRNDFGYVSVMTGQTSYKTTLLTWRKIGQESEVHVVVLVFVILVLV